MALTKYGRYETLHKIASGGMASVYLGRHLGAGGFERLVAIKVMHEHIAEDPSFSAMFLDEARLAAQIRHPNVVPTVDVADDGRYIVMEYIEGASLFAILNARRKDGSGHLPLAVALRIFVDALAGLHAAHELMDGRGQSLNLVHRDMSPHNVLVGVDGMSRITDFGIAFAEERLTSTRSGQLKGKLPYMSPEQLEDGPVTRTTDVYAAGCVLWEMLCGQRLFRGGNEAAVACMVLAGPERTVRDVRPETPPEVDEACMRALLRDGARYATALEFAEAVEAAADACGLRLAKHREVGPFAHLQEMTYPSAATLNESDDDPRPPELLVPSTVPVGAVPVTTLQLEDGGAPVTAPGFRASTLRSESGFPVPRPAAGVQASTLTSIPDEARPPSQPSRTPAKTIVLPEGHESLVDVLEDGRTTTEDRPPPAVAAVIRAEYDRRQSSPSMDPSVGPVSATASDIRIPKKTSWGSLIVALIAVGAVAAAVLWLTLGRQTEDPDRPASATDPSSKSSTTKAKSRPSSARSALPASSERRTDPAPNPRTPPSARTPRPSPTLDRPSPLPKEVAPPTSNPKPSSSVYHPEDP